MAASWRDSQSKVKLPGLGEDATPFLVKCYVKTGGGPFRPLHEFDLRPLQDEFKLYVWRSATLRDIAGLLYMRDPSLSLPNTLHSFRIVYKDTRRAEWVAREAGHGITRISRTALQEALDDVVEMSNESEQSEIFRKTLERTRPEISSEADEEASRQTLEDLDFTDGDVLDVTIKNVSSMKIRGGAEKLDYQTDANAWQSRRRLR